MKIYNKFKSGCCDWKLFVIFDWKLICVFLLYPCHILGRKSGRRGGPAVLRARLSSVIYIYTYINVLSFYLRIKDGNMKMMIMMREEGIHLKL